MTDDYTYVDYSREHPRGEESSIVQIQMQTILEQQNNEVVTEHGTSGNVTCNFPTKLYHILSRKDLSHIITWMPHGRSWKILKQDELIETVFKQYFAHRNFASFKRQVTGWGFTRITQGDDRNSYYHELFLRGMPHLIKRMKRPLQSSMKKAPPEPENEPDFYLMSIDYPLPQVTDEDDSSAVDESLPILVPVTETGSTSSADTSSDNYDNSHKLDEVCSRVMSQNELNRSNASSCESVCSSSSIEANQFENLCSTLTTQCPPLDKQDKFSSLRNSQQMSSGLSITDPVAKRLLSDFNLSNQQFNIRNGSSFSGLSMSNKMTSGDLHSFNSSFPMQHMMTTGKTLINLQTLQQQQRNLLLFGDQWKKRFSTFSFYGLPNAFTSHLPTLPQAHIMNKDSLPFGDEAGKK